MNEVKKRDWKGIAILVAAVFTGLATIITSVGSLMIAMKSKSVSHSAQTKATEVRSFLEADRGSNYVDSVVQGLRTKK